MATKPKGVGGASRHVFRSFDYGDTWTDELLSVAQAAKSLGISKMTIYRWSQSKPPKIASREVAGLLCIPKGEIERLLQKRRAPAETTEAPNRSVKR